MKRATGMLPRFLVLLALTTGAATGAHVLVTDHVDRSKPASVMGPGYNPAPPWIPVS